MRHAPDPGTAPLIWGLVAANVAVFVGWHVFGNTPGGFELMALNFLVSVESVLNLRVWTLVTSAFSHINAMHLLVNLFVLWVFGREVIRVTGNGAFVQLYLVGGILASVGHVLYGYLSGDATPALGASGSVMAIAVVYAALWPRRTLLLNFFIPVPAALAVALYILLDVMGVFNPAATGVAHAAHLGGALYGFLFWLVYLRPRIRRRRR